MTALGQPSTDALLDTAEHQILAAERCGEALAAVTASAANDDGTVEAVVTARGELLDLALHPSAARYGADELGRQIEETIGLAVQFARQRSYNVLALNLGDRRTAGIEAVAGAAPARLLGWDSAGKPAT